MATQLLPMHLKPQHDELLSSWLIRLSHANGFLPHSFCHQFWPTKAVWNRDIDHLATAEITQDLARLTAVSIQRAHETTLRAYEGVVFQEFIRSGRTRGILPVGVWHRVHLKYGLQYCPECLASDAKPYFRRAWRLAWVTCCTKHRRPLLDRCPKCAKPVNFHHNKGMKDSLARCVNCDFDLGKAPNTAAATTSELQAQRHLLEAIQRGWVEMPGYGAIYSHLYFDGLWALTEMLLSPRGRSALAGLVDDGLKAVARQPVWHQQIEDYDVGMRRVLVTAVFELSRDWPTRFLSVVRRRRLRFSDIKRDLPSLPYWVHDVLRRDLFYHQYEVNDEEVFHSVKNLVRLGLPLTQRNIYGLLGHFVPKTAKAQLRRIRAPKFQGHAGHGAEQRPPRLS
jgi:hypothetical protein